MTVEKEEHDDGDDENVSSGDSENGSEKDGGLCQKWDGQPWFSPGYFGQFLLFYLVNPFSQLPGKFTHLSDDISKCHWARYLVGSVFGQFLHLSLSNITLSYLRKCIL